MMTPRLNTFAKTLALAVLFGLASCGRDDAPQKKKESFNIGDSNPRLDKRFSVAEIDAVATAEDLPKQTPFLKYSYTMANAPTAFKAEYPNFTAGVELKGYFNTGVDSPGGDPRDSTTARLIVSALQSISLWKTIPGKDGKPLLKDSYTINAKGQKTADVVDGLIVEGQNMRNGNIVMNGQFPLTVTLEMALKRQDVGEFVADFRNPKAISVFPVGTIVKADGIKIHMEMFPYMKGWLVYAAAAAKLEQYTDQASAINETAEYMAQWLRTKAVPQFMADQD